VAYGGQAGGDKFWLAECPIVVKHPSGYYLFRTQSYGEWRNRASAQNQCVSL